MCSRHALVDRALGIFANEPIDIYVNPTYIPDQLAPEYDRLWTPARMKTIVDGLAAHGMAYMLMFDRAWTPEDEIRFSIFKFKLKKAPRPAWDYEYVIHKVETGKEYGYRARVVWKKFVSPEDCLKEYEKWVGH